MANPNVWKYAAMGGFARAKKLGKKRCIASARNAAKARWAKQKLLDNKDADAVNEGTQTETSKPAMTTVQG